MNDLFDKLNVWLADKLDVLKVKNPTLFFAVQGVIWFLAYHFNKGTIVLPTPLFLTEWFSIDNVNAFIAMFLMALSATVGSRTSAFKSK